MHQKTGLRNLILEKKLETINESLETKDAQINQILAAARIDPQALNQIRHSLEEVENLKNDAIREIQNELKKIREAHSNMVKTYEGKLSEFGIPVEELGFDPLVPANIWTSKLYYQYFNLCCKFVVIKQKDLEVPGFEPGAFHMRSKRDTTTPHSRRCATHPASVPLY